VRGGETGAAPLGLGLAEVVIGLGALCLAWAIVVVNLGSAPSPGPSPVLRARAALTHDPLDVTALRDLGLALDQASDPETADQILSLASRLGWRDGPTQAWLFARRLEQGRFAEALLHADALLRRDPDGAMAARLFPILIAATGTDAARSAMIARLEDAPPWRPAFLRALAGARDLAPARAILLALKAGPTPPPPQDVAPYIQRLVAEADDARALADWRTLNGGHETGPPDGTPFTWSEIQGEGAASEIAALPGGAGQSALRVAYDGYALPTLPRRLLALAPGPHHLGFHQWIQTGQPDPRMRWRIRCDRAAKPLAEATPPPAGAGWNPVSLDFTVPDAGCGGQWLELDPEPGERRQEIVAWYDFNGPQRR
jgi:hypothetical protein